MTPADAAWAHEFDRFFKHHAPAVATRARRLTRGDVQEAEDLVQETFLAAWRISPEFLRRSSGDQRAWLMTVVQHKGVDRWRKFGSVLPMPEFELPRAVAAEEVALSSLAVEQWLKLIEAMPRARHRVAYLRWQMDWSVADIAAHLDLARSTVRGHLKAARDALRQVAADHEVYLVDDASQDGPENGEEAQ